MRLGLGAQFGLGAVASLAFAAALIYGGWRVQQEGDSRLVQHSAESMQSQAREDLERRGDAIALLLAEALVNPVYFSDLQSIGQVAQSVLLQPDVEYVLVFDTQGRILHDGSPDIAQFGQTMRDAFGPAAALAAGPLVQYSDALIDVTHPMLLGAERIGGVRIGLSRAAAAARVRGSQERLAQSIAELTTERLRTLALPVAGLIGLALLGLLAVSRRLVRPVRTLAAKARAMERGDYAVVDGSTRNDEVGELVRAFNNLGHSIAARDRDVRRLAYLDTLTGLPNRHMLRETLSRAIVLSRSSGRALALLFVDLDDFKRINDTLGHDAGDEALTQLARRLENCLEAVRDGGKAPDEAADLIARFGGDEFVALLVGGEVRERASGLAERILEAVRDPLTAAGRPVYLNASIGITLFPDDAEDAQQLLKNGDIAMYQAKVHGKNCYRYFTDYMTRVAEDRLMLEQDLRAAIGTTQLEVHYQPIVDLVRDRIAGVEALLRWHHPQRGLVPTALFIGIAEDFGLIGEIGHFVMRRACADATHWPELDGEPLFVSVNVSVRQLRQVGLTAEVAAVLRDTGLPATRLHIELTESALLDDQPLALSTLAELRQAGIRIWLDDFGTGFSGLSHLRRVPVDGVKIDRSFTHDLLTDRDDLALTNAIIAMATSLGIPAVAEGIETQAQLEVLKNLRCDLGQGYWFGYPMKQSDLLAMFEQPEPLALDDQA
jgi:diguanylate cyclase (GGDEF)-like protein